MHNIGRRSIYGFFHDDFSSLVFFFLSPSPSHNIETGEFPLRLHYITILIIIDFSEHVSLINLFVRRIIAVGVSVVINDRVHTECILVSYHTLKILSTQSTDESHDSVIKIPYRSQLSVTLSLSLSYLLGYMRTETKKPGIRIILRVFFSTVNAYKYMSIL